jgi:hypothetical protein
MTRGDPDGRTRIPAALACVPADLGYCYAPDIRRRKKRWVLVLLAAFGIAAIVFVAMFLLTPRAHVSMRNVAIEFVVRDTQSRQPIPATSITVEDRSAALEAKRDWRVHPLIANDDGRAIWTRPQSMVEDMTTGFRTTTALVFADSCSLDVSAAGYVPLERVCLADLPCEADRVPGVKDVRIHREWLRRVAVLPPQGFQIVIELSRALR